MSNSNDKGAIACLSAILILGFFLASIVLQICTMMFGWGLSVHSWGWIIGNAIAQVLIYMLISMIGKLND